MSPRQRKISQADLYHITCRGVAKRILFECNDDRRFLGRLMRELLDEHDVELYAWCFMSNHMHMLLHADLEITSVFMRKLLSAYARYFNDKYDRVGHLFQDRFGSVAVATDAQLMATVRYIHRNPCEIPGQSFETYIWSSYREYVRAPFISETRFVLSLFNSIDEFAEFHKNWQPDDEKQAKPKLLHLDDIDAVAQASALLGIERLTQIAALDKAARDSMLASLKEAGFPISQIARITEINRNTVQRANRSSKQ